MKEIMLADGLVIFLIVPYSARMMNWGETANSSAEGEVATNSQAKGPNSDETLESLMTPKKQSLLRHIKN